MSRTLTRRLMTTIWPSRLVFFGDRVLPTGDATDSEAMEHLRRILASASSAAHLQRPKIANVWSDIDSDDKLDEVVATGLRDIEYTGYGEVVDRRDAEQRVFSVVVVKQRWKARPVPSAFTRLYMAIRRNVLKPMRRTFQKAARAKSGILCGVL